ncbi:MAG TPA: hypothetical protein DCL77_17310 [Prolixibacteraceae bacterium]|jgi:hypothetical protein|nr:hypothetical protein [Prolixibacteraceae bacterium]
MAKDLDIPLPVRFNPFKHHRNYILELLKSTSSEMIASLLDPVCNNYIDIYTGTMTPESISKAVIGILKSKHVFHVDDFTSWVDSKNGYREIKLEDQSEWVVRKSNEEERYIHLHPARTGPLSIRFKGSTLKTIYLLKIHFPEPQETLSLEDVNGVRIQIGLSPVKKLDKSKGILYCFEKFFRQDSY